MINIRHRREYFGITVNDLAAKVGTTASTLARYEEGKGKLPLYIIRRIYEALGIRTDVFENFETERMKANAKKRK